MPPSSRVTATGKTPGFSKVCEAAGPSASVPSPKSQVAFRSSAFSATVQACGTPGQSGGGTLRSATGGGVTSTRRVSVTRLLATPASSVAARLTVKVPASAKRCWAWTPDAVTPSPKSQAKRVIAPSGSVEAEASKRTRPPAATRSGASTTGAGGAFTETRRRVSMVPQPSLAPGRTARRVTVAVPGSAKACSTLGPVAVAPPPKSQAKLAPERSPCPERRASKRVGVAAAARSGPAMSMRGASTTVTRVSSVSRAPQLPRASPVMVRVTL